MFITKSLLFIPRVAPRCDGSFYIARYNARHVPARYNDTFTRSYAADESEVIYSNPSHEACDEFSATIRRIGLYHRYQPDDVRTTVLLTPAQYEALKYAAQGHSPTETANLLCISPDSYRDRVKRIHRKLGLNTPVSKMIWALQHGIGPAITVSPSNPPLHITPQELVVLREVATGKRNKESAKTLGLAEATIKSDTHNLRQRWQVDSTVKLVYKALQKGIIRLEEIELYHAPPKPTPPLPETPASQQ